MFNTHLISDVIKLFFVFCCHLFGRNFKFISGFCKKFTVLLKIHKSEMYRGFDFCKLPFFEISFDPGELVLVLSIAF